MSQDLHSDSIKNRERKAFIYILVGFCVLIILAHFTSSFFKDQRLWGLNHLAYFSIYFRIGITLLGFLILISLVNQEVRNILRKPLNWVYNKTISQNQARWGD